MKLRISNELRAMFWKESRELGKWAIIGSIGLCIAMLYIVGSKSNVGVGEKWPNIRYEDFWSGIKFLLTITAPIMALLMAMLQIFPELRRDQWAFLIHRPASRTVLFWGKVSAGLCLYFLAMCIPFLMAALWAKTPGNIAAPFEWQLTQSGFATILNGCVFYFAGLIVALRPSRWYGSRILPLVTAIAATLLITVMAEFWQAILITMLSILIFATAAHGSFLTTGSYFTQSLRAKFALGFTLYVGLIVILFIITFISVNSAQQILNRDSSKQLYTIYKITKSGEIIRILYRGGEISSVQDLHGKSLPIPSDNDIWGNDYLSEYELYDIHWYKHPTYNEPNRVDVLEATTHNTLWYYVFSQNRLLGYSSTTHQLIGYLTPSGFTSAAQSSQHSLDHFQGPVIVSPYSSRDAALTESHLILQFPRSIYLVDLDKLSAKPFYTTNDPRNLTGVNMAIYGATGGFYASEVAPHIGLLTRQQLQIFANDGTPILSVPRTENPDIYQNVILIMMPNRNKFFVRYTHNGNASDFLQMPSIIAEYSKQGTLIEKFTLPPEAHSNQDSSGPWQLFGLLTPPVLTSICGAYYAYAYQIHTNIGHDFHREFLQNRLRMTLFGLLSLISGLVSAFFAWLIGHRCAFAAKGQWAWAVGAFWLGLPGVLLMLALFDWPAREICPTCHKKRVVNRTNCEHCGSGFAIPTHDGTEIFEEITPDLGAETHQMEGIK